MGGLRSQSGRFEEQKNILPLQGFEAQSVRPVASPFTNYFSPASREWTNI